MKLKIGDRVLWYREPGEHVEPETARVVRIQVPDEKKGPQDVREISWHLVVEGVSIRLHHGTTVGAHDIAPIPPRSVRILDIDESISLMTLKARITMQLQELLGEEVNRKALEAAVEAGIRQAVDHFGVELGRNT